MRRPLAVTLIAVTAVTACKTDRAPAADTTARTAAGQSTAAAPVHDAVIITSPTKGATTGTDVTVTMRATGVTIAKGGQVIVAMDGFGAVTYQVLWVVTRVHDGQTHYEAFLKAL